MKICTTEQEYIDAIAPAVRRVCKRYGYLPSVLIAQSCLENGYGIRSYWDNPQIEALLGANNMVGIKSQLLNASWSKYSVWPGRSITKRTPEEYGGRMVTITDDFRAYDNIEQSFADFLLFIRYASNFGDGGVPKYGPEVLAIKDPEALIRTVAGRGYATGSTYPTSVMRIVNKHSLTQYDNLAGVTQTEYAPGVKTPKAAEKKEEEKTVAKKALKTRQIHDITARNRGQVPRSRGGNKIEFIVCHYLGVPNADNPDLYGGGYGGHYNITRAGEVYKAADPRTAVVWHCGGGLQGSGGHRFFGVCTNFNSIGIECGVCYTETGVKDPSGDSDKWYFTEETQESLVWLVSRLMDEYGVPIDRVIRHYDVTGKICPNPYVKNNHTRTSWTWTEFISNVRQYRKDGTITVPAGGSSGTVVRTDDIKRGDRGEGVRSMQEKLIFCGFDCGKYGADGDFGSATQEAVPKFQASTGQPQTGIFSPADAKILDGLYTQQQARRAWTPTGTATAKLRCNVRSGPAAKYSKIRPLNPGDRFEIDGTRSGSWVHVRVVDVIGWLWSPYVVYDK